MNERLTRQKRLSRDGIERCSCDQGHNLKKRGIKGQREKLRNPITWTNLKWIFEGRGEVHKAAMSNNYPIWHALTRPGRIHYIGDIRLCRRGEGSGLLKFRLC